MCLARVFCHRSRLLSIPSQKSGEIPSASAKLPIGEGENTLGMRIASITCSMKCRCQFINSSCSVAASLHFFSGPPEDLLVQGCQMVHCAFVGLFLYALDISMMIWAKCPSCHGQIEIWAKSLVHELGWYMQVIGRCERRYRVVGCLNRTL